jgi:DNA replication protein DnaC
LAAAIGLTLVENGWRVLFMRTNDLVQRLQIARRKLALEGALDDAQHLIASVARTTANARDNQENAD